MCVSGPDGGKNLGCLVALIIQRVTLLSTVFFFISSVCVSREITQTRRRREIFHVRPPIHSGGDGKSICVCGGYTSDDSEWNFSHENDSAKLMRLRRRC